MWDCFHWHGEDLGRMKTIGQLRCVCVCVGGGGGGDWRPLLCVAVSIGMKKTKQNK